MDDLANANAGNVKRKAFISESKNRYLINGVDMSIKLMRNSNAFCMMAADDSAYKLRVMKASFFVRKVKVNSAVQLKHIEKLDKQLIPAIYPIRRVEVNLSA